MSITRGPLAADNFTISPNHWSRCDRISYKAKGLLVAIAGHSASYELTIKQLTEESRDGKDSVMSGITELEEAGFLVRVRQRDDGGQYGGYDYRLVEMPAHHQCGFSHSGETRTGVDQQEQQESAGQNQSGFSDAVNPPTKKTTSKKTTKKTSSEEEPDPRVQPILQGWIDYTGSKGVKLTGRQIAIYGREIKTLLAQDFPDKLIKSALGRMLDRNQQGRPTLLDSFVAEIQGRQHVFPTSGAPVGAAAKPLYPTAAERRQDAKEREMAILEIMDGLIGQLKAGGIGYNPLDIEQQRAVQAEAEKRYDMSLQVENDSTGCQPVPYTGNRQTEPVDAEWDEVTPPKELTSHATA